MSLSVFNGPVHSSMGYFYILVEGCVRVYGIGQNGKLFTLMQLVPPDIMGGIEWSAELENSSFIFRAKEDSAVIRISYANLSHIARNDASFLKFLNKVYANKLIKSGNKSINLAVISKKNRFAHKLLNLADRDFVDDEPFRIPISNYKNLSDDLGVSYRHLMRIIQEFISRGIIERYPKGIAVLKPRALYEMAKEAYSEYGEKPKKEKP